MDKKKLTLTLSLLCVAVLSASCNSGKSSSSNTSVVTDMSSGVVSSASSENASVTAGATTDKNKNTASDSSASDNNDMIIDTEKKVAIIPVTNEQGKKVTDSAGKTVTEVVVIDQSNKPVTDTMGNNVPPNVAGESVNFKYGSLLWMAGHHSDPSNNGQHVFDVIKEDGKIFAIQFKVNEKAASGDYEISFQRKTSSGSGAFSTDAGTGISTNYSPGIISVGSSTAKAENEYNGFTCYFTNAAANPGDTVTIYGCVKNNSEGFSAFNTYFRYDSDAFTLQSIKAAGLIENSGEFMSS